MGEGVLVEDSEWEGIEWEDDLSCNVLNYSLVNCSKMKSLTTRV